MPDLNIRHFRLAAALTLAAAVTLTALVAVAPAVSAAPLSTKSVILEKLGEAAPLGSVSVSTAAIDENTGRAYVVDRTSHYVLVYDTTGTTLSLIASMPVSRANFIAVNSTTHEVFVFEPFLKDVVVLDGTPGSPSEYDVIDTIPTGTTAQDSVAVDSTTNVLYVVDNFGTDVLAIDRATHLAHAIDIAPGLKAFALDAVTHNVYIANGSTVTTIAPDLSVRTVTLPFSPISIAASGDAVLIASSSDIGRYDPATWTRVATSPPTLDVAHLTIDMDQKRGIAFVAYPYIGERTVQVVRTDDMSLDGTITLDKPITGLAFDTNRIVTTRSGSAGAFLTMYSVTDRTKPSVERIGGADRFAVSAAISAKTYATGSPVAYVASGAVFTDALSASAAAGAEGGGVLLVQKNAIPPVIADELTRLKPQQIIVLGGTDTIDTSVETALKAYSNTVTRTGGADRYAVSAAVSLHAFGPMRPVAYIASGAVFPDALSGSAGAGRQGGPVLLVEKDGIPTVVQTELERLAPSKIVVLGGTNTVSDSVVSALGKLAPTARIGGADRFAVSAGVSANAFPAETPIAYVASGTNFPDALSGGAAAIANGAPVLLVNPDTLPATIDAELDRLLPTRVIILGGTNSVSDAVATAVANH